MPAMTCHRRMKDVEAEMSLDPKDNAREDIRISWSRCRGYRGDMSLPWDITIMSTRYGGCYEGAPWLAFTYLPEDNDVHSGDTECDVWFCDREEMLIGRGATPDAALADIKARMEKGAPEWVFPPPGPPMTEEERAKMVHVLKTRYPQHRVNAAFYGKGPAK